MKPCCCCRKRAENAWARHRNNHEALKAGFEAMGLRFRREAAAPAAAQRQVHSGGYRRSRGAQDLLADYNIEIGAGLGPLAGKIWRFGLMGYSSWQENVLLALSALSAVLGAMGYRHDAGAAEVAAHGAYAEQHAAAATNSMSHASA